MPSTAPSLKQKAHALIDQLPDTVGWQELIEEMRFRQAVEAGIAQADAGQFGSADAVRAVFVPSTVPRLRVELILPEATPPSASLPPPLLS